MLFRRKPCYQEGRNASNYYVYVTNVHVDVSAVTKRVTPWTRVRRYLPAYMGLVNRVSTAL